MEAKITVEINITALFDSMTYCDQQVFIEECFNKLCDTDQMNFIEERIELVDEDSARDLLRLLIKTE